MRADMTPHGTIIVPYSSARKQAFSYTILLYHIFPHLSIDMCDFFCNFTQTFTQNGCFQVVYKKHINYQIVHNPNSAFSLTK